MKYNKLVITITFIFILLATFKSPNDPDFGWHYKYGEYIFKNKQLLRDNIFSYTFTDYKWANSYWLSQTLMYTTHFYLGHFWAGLLFAFVLSLAVIWYVKFLGKKANSPTFLMSLVAIVLVLEFFGASVVVRPMYFSSLFLMIVTLLLLRNKELQFSRVLLILPFIFLFWTNMHADFILGLFVFGLYLLEIFYKSIKRLDFKKPLLPSVLFVLSIIATVANPYSFHLWETLAKEAHPYQFKHIVEWVPVTTQNIPRFIYFCGSLGLLITALVGSRNALPTWYMLAVGIFSIASFRSQYFLRVALILGTYAMLLFWTPYAKNLVGIFSFEVFKKARFAFIVFLLIVSMSAGVVFLDQVEQSLNKDYFIKKQRYPKKALDWVLDNNIGGNVFNYYGWGGYIIWEYPQLKTFIDGRMPSWRQNEKSIFEDYIDIIGKPRENIYLLDDYKVGWVLFPSEKERKFIKFLLDSPNWYKAYEDDVALVFVRKQP